MAQIPSISSAMEDLMQGDLAGLMSGTEGDGDGTSDGSMSWLTSFSRGGSSAFGG